MSLILIWLSVVAAVADGTGAASKEPLLHKETVVRFASVREGREAIRRRDRFTDSLSRFDLQSRLKTDREVTTADLLDFAADQVVAWEDGDIEKLSKTVRSVKDQLEDYDIPFPKRILLVHTTGKEESNAAYCRGNAIILPRRVVARNAEQLERLLLHELFHVLSSHQPELRKRLYGIIGFHPCKEIKLPESLKDRKITNPDAPKVDCYIELKSGVESTYAAPVLYASVDQYDAEKGGSFFRYLQFRLLALKKDGGRLRPVIRDGKPWLLDPQKTPSFFDQIGRNTNYIIHPDEILADNFVHTIKRPERLSTPRIVEEMEKLLKK